MLEQIPENALIESIDIQVFNVFDEDNPEERTWYAKLANSLHILSRKNVIRDQLLFQVGDKWSAETVVESERLLRSRSYLYNVKIRAVRICGLDIRVQVLVRDVWTLTGGIGLSRSGGENDTNVSITDKNFLGTGTLLSVGRDKDSERTTSFISFMDPNLFGTRWQMKASYKDKDDGDGKSLSFDKPFYSLDSRNSYRFAVLQDERIDSLYFRNVVFEKFTHQQETADISLGNSNGLIGQQAFRWKIGLHFEDHIFEANALTSNASEIPNDRNRSYIWVGFEQIENNYLESKNSDQIGQTEDIFLGQRIKAKLGYGISPSGENWPFWYLSAEFQDTYQPTEHSLAHSRVKGSSSLSVRPIVG